MSEDLRHQLADLANSQQAMIGELSKLEQPRTIDAKSVGIGLAGLCLTALGGLYMIMQDIQEQSEKALTRETSRTIKQLDEMMNLYQAEERRNDVQGLMIQANTDRIARHGEQLHRLEVGDAAK